MRAARFSIGSLLAVIGILAVALAALRNPSYLWANAAFTAALAAVLAAVVSTVFGRGARRAYWLGFALFGGTYLAICSTPVLRDSVCPRLVTEPMLDMLYPFAAPDGARPIGGIPGMNMTPTPQPSPWAAWTAPDRSIDFNYRIGSIRIGSPEAFRQIGHSLAALIVATLGGLFARNRYLVFARDGKPAHPA